MFEEPIITTTEVRLVETLQSGTAQSQTAVATPTPERVTSSQWALRPEPGGTAGRQPGWAVERRLLLHSVAKDTFDTREEEEEEEPPGQPAGSAGACGEMMVFPVPEEGTQSLVSQFVQSLIAPYC